MHATLCDLITDLTQNAFEAESTNTILEIKESENNLSVLIADNGHGMSEETIERAKDPFFSDGRKHPHRKVGLGLPFLMQTAETTGGLATIESSIGEGTTIRATFDPRHVDLPAFGDFAATAVTLMTYGFEGNLTIHRTRKTRSYTITKNELIEVLGDLNDLESLTLLKQFMSASEQELANF